MVSLISAPSNKKKSSQSSGGQRNHIVAAIDHSKYNHAFTYKHKPYGFLSRDRPLYPVTLSFEEIQEYELAFKNYDVNKDGVICVDELCDLLERVGLRPSEKEVVEMINSVDMNNDGVLSFCEFVKLMSRQHNPFITPKEQFESVFRVFDRNNSGHLSRVEFKNTLFSISLRISEEELDSILDNLDRDKDGLISKREFLKVFITGDNSA
ncbi:calmodulin-A-like [Bolinopsis microptera]|uniref:calmodulin-A-like n=1 Tax=Bolinopsis microptera TaxID=2820187 RepID=UPI003078D36B